MFSGGQKTLLIKGWKYSLIAFVHVSIDNCICYSILIITQYIYIYMYIYIYIYKQDFCSLLIHRSSAF